MERKRILYWIVQLAGWTAYFLFSILLLISSGSYSFTSNLYLYCFSLIVIAILISHGMRYFIIRRKLLSKGFNKLVPTTLLMAIVTGFALETTQVILEEMIELDFMNFADDSDYHFSWASFLFGVSRSIILFLVWAGFYFVFGIAEKSRAQEITNLKWEASKNEIELKNLRAQLNPHFLFNSLNSIRALVGINPEQAKTSVTQLSNLLRRSINLGKMRMIPLKEELDLVKIYLDLEKVRFEERLTIETEIDPESLSAEIPPLMVQTIVENGIKHGISKSLTGGVILIHTEKQDNNLTVIIKNSGELIEPEENDNGIGVQNSRKRLRLLFGDKANLNMEQVGENVVVTINIEYE